MISPNLFWIGHLGVRSKSPGQGLLSLFNHMLLSHRAAHDSQEPIILWRNRNNMAPHILDAWDFKERIEFWYRWKIICEFSYSLYVMLEGNCRRKAPGKNTIALQMPLYSKYDEIKTCTIHLWRKINVIEMCIFSPTSEFSCTLDVTVRKIISLLKFFFLLIRWFQNITVYIKFNAQQESTLYNSVPYNFFHTAIAWLGPNLIFKDHFEEWE